MFHRWETVDLLRGIHAEACESARESVAVAEEFDDPTWTSLVSDLGLSEAFRQVATIVERSMLADAARALRANGDMTAALCLDPYSRN